MKTTKYDIDMTRGPLFSKIIAFALPLMATGILQLLYNAADVVVVGRFSGKEALAAVGSTGALINLIINVFTGLAIGSGVVIARYFGGGNTAGVHRAVHTAISVAALSGLGIGIFGFCFSGTFLRWMGTPDDVIGLSELYMKIYFCGAPASLLYNFGAAILRAVGDTRRPLYFLTISGAVNVALNLVLVLCFGMSVDGVAIATVASQVLSAFFVLRCLLKTDSCCRLSLRELKIYRTELVSILRVGLPAGIQGSIFSISNVLIQSSVNSFGSVTMAGNTAAANIEGFIYTSMNAYHQAALTFTSQNLGARNYERAKRSAKYCLLTVMVVGFSLSMIAVLLGKYLLRLYNDDADVISFGLIRMKIICSCYMLNGMMDVLAGIVRGMGYPLAPTIITALGACGFRVLWIYTVFAATHSIEILYASYPISWILSAGAEGIFWLCVRKRVKAKYADGEEPAKEAIISEEVV